MIYENMDKKRVFIIHGWEFKPKHNWYPWLKKELENRGFKVVIPEMPNTEEPKIEAWVQYLNKVVGEPDEQTYFVGHSIGCQAILRYLEKVDKKIGGVVCVGGWFELIGIKEETKVAEGSSPDTSLKVSRGEEVLKVVRPWLETPIDFEKVKNTTDKFIAILSDDDYYVSFEKHQKSFKENLGAEIIIEHKKGHFVKDDGVTELPSILESVLKISK